MRNSAPESMRCNHNPGTAATGSGAPAADASGGGTGASGAAPSSAARWRAGSALSSRVRCPWAAAAHAVAARDRAAPRSARAGDQDGLRAGGRGAGGRAGQLPASDASAPPASTRFFSPSSARSMMTFSALRLIMPSMGILTSTVSW